MATFARHRVLCRLAAALLVAPLAAAQPWQSCGQSGNYSANGTYQSNLAHSPATLPNNAYATPLCRGDANASACESCVATAFQDAQQLCPYDKDVFIVYDLCYLAFSNKNILAAATYDGNPKILMNTQTVSAPAEVFDAAVATLLNATSRYAAENSSRRFGTGEESFDSANPTIYGLSQCTPDMSPDDCRSCLGGIIALIPQYLSRRKGGRAIGMRCNFRYEVGPFFAGGSMLRLPAPAAAPPPAQANSTPTAPTGDSIQMAEHIESTDSLFIDLSTLRAATGNFSESNRIGGGGFGSVYKGVLPSGEEVAVKRLSMSSGQGIEELKNELVLVAKLQQKNLVRLVGVCLQEHEKLLVYEYMPNRSIDTILFDLEKRKELDWGKRFRIINGIARALQYLHEDSQLRIIHRDLKASNVLLDSDYTPKVSDFGLARLFGGDQTREVTSHVVGTYGYMAPEYAMRGHYSVKSDVFSFGILMIEIVTGKRSSGSYSFDQSYDLLSLVWEHWTMGTILEMMDPSLTSHAPRDQMLKCVHIGLLCVQDNPADRPMMSTVNIMLSSNTVSLQSPSKPSFFIPRSATDSNIYSESYPLTSQPIRRSGVVSVNDVSFTVPHFYSYLPCTDAVVEVPDDVPPELALPPPPFFLAQNAGLDGARSETSCRARFVRQRREKRILRCILPTAAMLAVAVVVVVAVLLPLAAAQQPMQFSSCASGAYAANSTYEANLALLAAALPANASSTAAAGYATATVGVVPDQVSALALCRGDANATACRSCVAASFRVAQRDCPSSKDATTYQDDCVVRFSDQRFLDFVGVNSPVSELYSDSDNNITAVPVAWFNAAVVALMNATVDTAVAAGNNSTNTKKYFATAVEDFDPKHYPKIYGMAQCAPVMTAAQCRSCLGGFVSSIPWFLNGKPGGRVLGIWCNLRYSVKPFYQGQPMLQISAPPEPPPPAVPLLAAPPTRTARTRRIAGISAGVACFVILMLILSAYAFIRFKRKKAAKKDNLLKKMARGKCTIFDLYTLKEATENFSEKHKLGEGGFGTVYKGKLPDGQEIAVKKLIESCGHGLNQLHNEVLVLAQLQHKNLVRLQGFCVHKDEMLLVYEYMKNGSLDNFLFDASRGNILSWDQQYNIILGIAKGIMYLHEDSSIRIIHRDLKANNVLLDEDMDPKIADFGLARLLGGGHTHTMTTRVVGTYGYMAPEYAIHGNVSPKIDIFSFGVMVLEIVTKRKNCSSGDGTTDTLNLLSDVWSCWTEGVISQVIDQSLEGHFRNQALRCIHIGLLCVQSDPDDRPDIPSVIFMLTRDNMELQPPTEPAFFFNGDSNSASQPSDQRVYVYDRMFDANLNLLAAALPANVSASPAGFAVATVGTDPDQVFALALCRGDVNASACSACVAAAFVDGKKICPGINGVTVYEDACVVRFSGQRFMDFLSPDQWQVTEMLWAPDQASESVNVPAVGWFDAAVAKILAAMVDHAVAEAGNSTTKKYFVTGKEEFDPNIYGFAQCVPDLTPAQCNDCLKSLLFEAKQWYLGKSLSWVRINSVWCRLMYSVQPFYGGRAMLELSAPPPPTVEAPVLSPKPGAGKKKSAAVIAAGFASSVMVLLILSVFAFLRFRRRTKVTETDHPLRKITRAQCLIFDLPALQEATENFSENNKLGEGGYGIVYKGVLSDGQEVAVKKLLGTSGHGLDQLQNEVLLLAELQHKNLVRLQGFCLHQGETLLVYEYVKNRSLDNFLFDTSRGNALNWEQLYNIIFGIAKGILYLHEDSSLRIIHRDLKPNNILLGEDMEPKIADFGLARLLGEGHTNTRTTRIVGTFGYMAPEYAIHGNVSTKIDVFSFGVLVLEIVTRRRNFNSEDHDRGNLLSDVWNCWTKGTVTQLIDQSFEGQFRSQVLRCIHVGLLCVQSDPDDRPHMSSVIFMLSRENMNLQPPAQPAFCFDGDSNSGSQPSEQLVYDQPNAIYEKDISVNKITITDIYPR
uniref:Serine/threonine-protein kinase n=1 Tax=Oryza punctata TaxID=4537 RepID=A0A0E0LLP5_ORYPU